jgi:hypothetical protein
MSSHPRATKKLVPMDPQAIVLPTGPIAYVQLGHQAVPYHIILLLLSYAVLLYCSILTAFS